jgi:hypothetical protein
VPFQVTASEKNGDVTIDFGTVEAAFFSDPGMESYFERLAKTALEQFELGIGDAAKLKGALARSVAVIPYDGQHRRKH